jgi:hypothetical protein
VGAVWWRIATALHTNESRQVYPRPFAHRLPKSRATMIFAHEAPAGESPGASFIAHGISIHHRGIARVHHVSMAPCGTCTPMFNPQRRLELTRRRRGRGRSARGDRTSRLQTARCLAAWAGRRRKCSTETWLLVVAGPLTRQARLVRPWLTCSSGSAPLGGRDTSESSSPRSRTRAGRSSRPWRSARTPGG